MSCRLKTILHCDPHATKINRMNIFFKQLKLQTHVNMTTPKGDLKFIKTTTNDTIYWTHISEMRLQLCCLVHPCRTCRGNFGAGRTCWMAGVSLSYGGRWQHIHAPGSFLKNCCEMVDLNFQRINQFKNKFWWNLARHVTLHIYVKNMLMS